MVYFVKFIRKVLNLLNKKPTLKEYPNNFKDYKIGKNICIGKHTYGKPIILSWDHTAKLKIGNFCSISDNVVIILGGDRDHKYYNVSTYPFHIFLKEFKYLQEESPPIKKDVIIGNDVWIGYGATILSGVKIGDGAIIGAKAVVSKSVGPYSIVVGNPGKVIKKRFDGETIKKLLKIKWWNFDLKKIKSNIPLLLDKDISAFIKNQEC